VPDERREVTSGPESDSVHLGWMEEDTAFEIVKMEAVSSGSVAGKLGTPIAEHQSMCCFVLLHMWLSLRSHNLPRLTVITPHVGTSWCGWRVGRGAGPVW
jgi:hypothetical protein